MQLQLAQMVEKLAELSPDHLIEVDDFIDFLRLRDRDRFLRRSLAQASEEAFNAIWDNDDDAIYDDL